MGGIEPGVEVLEAAVGEVALGSDLGLFAFALEAHAGEAFAAEGEGDVAGGPESAADGGVFEEAVGSDSAGSGDGFEFLGIFDGQEVAEEMVGVGAGDRVGDLDFLGERAFQDFLAEGGGEGFGRVNERFGFAAGWGTTEDIEGIAVVFFADEDGPAMSAEGEFEGGPPAFGVGFDFDEAAELLGAAGEAGLDGIESGEGAGASFLADGFQFMGQLAEAEVGGFAFLTEGGEEGVEAEEDFPESSGELLEGGKAGGVLSGGQGVEEGRVHRDSVGEAGDGEGSGVAKPVGPMGMAVGQLLADGAGGVTELLDFVVEGLASALEVVEFDLVGVAGGFESGGVDGLFEGLEGGEGGFDGLLVFGMFGAEAFEAGAMMFDQFVGLGDIEGMAEPGVDGFVGAGG